MDDTQGNRPDNLGDISDSGLILIESKAGAGRYPTRDTPCTHQGPRRSALENSYDPQSCGTPDRCRANLAGRKSVLTRLSRKRCLVSSVRRPQSPTLPGPRSPTLPKAHFLGKVLARATHDGIFWGSGLHPHHVRKTFDPGFPHTASIRHGLSRRKAGRW